MIPEIKNPKSLNIEGINLNGKKVTIGFKCPPAKKYSLAKAAEKLGLTLSEHVENIIMNEGLANPNHENETRGLQLLIKELGEKVSFYENDFLKTVFNKYKFQKIKMNNPKGELVEIEISSMQDVYSVIINSFIIEK